MIFNNYYDLSLYFNGHELSDIDPESYSFSVHDSIKSFYSSASLQIVDPSGIFHESLFDCEGNIFKIHYGINKSTSFESNYVVINNETPDIMRTGLLSGHLNINMLHEFYDYQVVENNAYKGRISDIVSKLVSTYPFGSIDKNDTGSDSIWYQMSMTQKDFVEKVLIPNAYSSNANNSPFACFITTDNKFNFRNYYWLLNNKKNITLVYKPRTQDDTSLTSIIDIKPFRKGSKYSKIARYREIVTRDYTTGSYSKEYSSITDNPTVKLGNLKVPIVCPNNKKVTNYEYYSFTKKENGESESLKARKNYIDINSYDLDKLLITTLFNPDLHSGMVITINASVARDTGIEYGLSQSGQYLIEDCIHSWDGISTRKGITTLVVSRKFMSVPNYLVKDLLIS